MTRADDQNGVVKATLGYTTMSKHSNATKELDLRDIAALEGLDAEQTEMLYAMHSTDEVSTQTPTVASERDPFITRAGLALREAARAGQLNPGEVKTLIRNLREEATDI
jgi:hypothetical protein